MIFIYKNMSKYNSLFEKGYYFGELSEMSFDVDEFIKISNDVYSFYNDVNYFFNFQHVLGNCNLPHKILPSEKKERIEYSKNHPEFDVMSSAYILKKLSETEHCFNYFNKIISNFIPKVFSTLNENNVKISDYIQLYENGDFQNGHTDGHVGECVMILYLSDPKKYNYSGRFEILEEYPGGVIESLDPIRGNYCLLELTEHNQRHGVEIVKDNFKRFSYLAQIQKIIE